MTPSGCIPLLTLAIACAPTLASCAPESSPEQIPTIVNFAPVFIAGNTLHYLHTLSAQDTNTIPNAGNFSTDATVARTFSLHILSVDDLGNADITLSLNRFELSIAQNNSTLIAFDSNLNLEPTNLVEQALQSLASLSLNATLDPAGNIVEFQPVSLALPQGTRLPQQVVPFYNDEWFKTVLTTVWHIQSESQSIAVGDTWDTTLDSTLAGTSAVTTTHSHELVAADESLATIQGTGIASIEFNPSASDDVQSIQITDQALTFSLKWNRSLGALETYETEQLLKLQINRTGMVTTTDRRSLASLRRLDTLPTPNNPLEPVQNTP